MEHCYKYGIFYLTNPCIDAHFWVERNGEIIDPHFENQFSYIQKVWKCNDTKCYLEASDEIQEAVINHFKKCVMKQFKVRKWEKAVDILKTVFETVGYKPTFGECWKNVLLEVIVNGGTIKFGSMGFEKIDGNGNHWEFGGEDYTIKQFGRGKAFCKTATK
jgi:hypothetical protein